MSAPGKDEVIIIKKRGKGHKHAHHGGAWKVAYADFVTAMMAFFMVLWLMNSSQNVKEVVAGYFQDPAGAGNKAGTHDGSGSGMSVSETDMSKLKEKIEAAMRELPQFKEALKDRVEMVVTPEGLRIEFLENEKGLFFLSGSPTPTERGQQLIQMVAKEVKSLPNSLLVEGHTDSHQFSANSNYGNWELSSDRANAARRAMLQAGLAPQRISQVRGFADQRLKLPKDPQNPANRRISIVVQTQQQKPTVAKAEKGHKAEAGSHDAKPSGGHEQKAAESHGANAPESHDAKATGSHDAKAAASPDAKASGSQKP